MITYLCSYISLTGERFRSTIFHFCEIFPWSIHQVYEYCIWFFKKITVRLLAREVPVMRFLGVHFAIYASIIYAGCGFACKVCPLRFILCHSANALVIWPLMIYRDCSVFINDDIRDGHRHEMWLPLQNIKMGRVHLAITVTDVAAKVINLLLSISGKPTTKI